MGSLGIWEMVALAVLALLIFGPDKLPGMARQTGQVVAKFRREANATLSELKQAVDAEADLAELKGLRDEVRGVQRQVRDVKQSIVSGLGTAALTDHADAKPHSAGGPAAAAQPAPFDHDAT